MSNSELKMVAIKDIAISKTNPRKTFDEKSMVELQESIKQHGILQPILIRPKGKKYELVCGERRFRAATAAEFKDVPANIRTLSDDEAFELQIIENLERKDVHPLEEAEAFKRMLDSSKYTISDIAAKVAKPETFVAQRLKLVDLTDELKSDFIKGCFGIGHAILIARCQPVDQKGIYNEARRGWNVDPENPVYGTIADLKSEIEDETYLLEDAPFPLIANNLIKGVGACSKCPKRTSTNPMLFPDMQTEDRCMDKICFTAKSETFIEKEVAKIINNADDIPFTTDYSGSMTDTVKSILKEYNLTPLKNYDDWNSHERTGWELKKTFNVSDGVYKDVYIKPKDNSKSEATQGNDVKDEIKKIQDRASRALELDNVKIFKAIKEDDGLFKVYKQNDGDLSPLEMKAMWYLFKREVAGWHVMKEYNDMIGCPDSYNDLKEFEFYQKTNVQDLNLNKLVRMAIIDKLSEQHEPNYGKCGKSKFLFEIMKEKNPDAIKEFEDSQKAIAEKRISRSNSKIEKLKKDIKKPSKV